MVNVLSYQDATVLAALVPVGEKNKIG